MAKAKGSKKTGGRKKGAINKNTSFVKDNINKILKKELSEFSDLLKKLDERDRVMALIKLMSMVVPKPMDLKLEVTEPPNLEITVITPTKSNIRVDEY